MYRFRCLSLVLLCLLIGLTVTPFVAAFSPTTTVGELADRNRTFTGDYDEMVKRRVIRVLVPYSKTFFFLDGAEPKGLSYEAIVGFSNQVNEEVKEKNLEVKVVVTPTTRDLLLTRLNEGLGDIAVGNLTITDERLEMVDFSDPFMTGVSEVPVTSENDATLNSPLDLAGKIVHVRKSSSYYSSLRLLNEVFSGTGKPKINLILADEHLEDEDLLEMVNANLMPMVVVDKHKAEFWAQILPDIKIHPEAAVSSNGKIGWAIRKGNPKLKEQINKYAKAVKKGTLHGNVVFNKYLKDTSYIHDSVHGENMKRFQSVVGYFQKYGEQYHFDYLMLTALGFQESRLNQKLKSEAGAVGVMQILPSTAKDKSVAIADIYDTENNIHAGTKYLRYIADRYFSAESGIDELNRALFSFASYNAGPAKIAKVRKRAQEQGLDPNVWFNNVELMAARHISRETVQYVSNVFKYYIAYKLAQEESMKRQGR